MQTDCTGVVGVDEAGRGAWAGPVVAAACSICDPGAWRSAVRSDPVLQKVADSKQVSSLLRSQIYARLCLLKEKGVIDFCVGKSSARMIDTYGIREANRKAMRKAIFGLRADISHQQIQIDGRDNYAFRGTPSDQIDYIIGGDSKILEIALASIIAKVTRDGYMTHLHKQLPSYGFDRHKGYGTKIHHQALIQDGPTQHHRLSYQPIRAIYSSSIGTP